MATEPQITLITVFHNGLHALKLMWRSYCQRNREPALLWCFDNNSNDGAEVYAHTKARFIVRCFRNAGHAAGLDILCRLAQTPYTLIADVDIEFLEEAAGRMLDEFKTNSQALCVAYPSLSAECIRIADKGGTAIGQKRINPCCALFDTLKLQRLLQCVSFGVVRGEHRFYDVGGILYAAGMAAGLPILEPLWLRTAVQHHGNIGCLLANAYKPGMPNHTRVTERYQSMQVKAEQYPEAPDAAAIRVQTIGDERQLWTLRGIPWPEIHS